MAAVANERVVNGIKTRVLHNKDYVEVAERVRIAHAGETRRFKQTSTEQFSIGNRWFVRCHIEVDDFSYIGTAEIKFDAPKSTPDGTNPMECAETSALGRALAFAGLGTVESIASFDEVKRSEYIIEAANESRVVDAGNGHKQLPSGKPAPVEESGDVASPPHDEQAPTPQELRRRFEAMRDNGAIKGEFDKLVEHIFHRPMTTEDLDPPHCLVVAKKLEEYAAKVAMALR